MQSPFEVAFALTNALALVNNIRLRELDCMVTVVLWYCWGGVSTILVLVGVDRGVQLKRSHHLYFSVRSTFFRPSEQEKSQTDDQQTRAKISAG